MNMAKRNLISGVVLLGFVCWYGWLTTQLPARDIMPNTPGPAFFPWLITAILLVLSIALVMQGLRPQLEEDEPPAMGNMRMPIIMLVGFLAYIICLSYLGFILASIPFFAFLMWMFSERRVVNLVVTSMIVPVVLYLIFNKGFQVILPNGLLGF